MKKIAFITIVFLSLSCEKELIEQPKSLAVESFYNTSSEIESAIGAIYAPIRSSNGIGTLYINMLETFSDYFEGRGSWGPNSDYEGLNSTNISRVTNIWDNLYLGIRNANLVIKNVPNAAELNENDKNRYIAEAMFLRALCYFHLARNWAAVPLRTELNMDEPDISKSPIDDVYKLMVSDLTFAEDKLPDSAPLPGKPSKWAAKTILTDVYFYLHMNAEASNKASEVIQSGKYSLINVTVSDDYDKIFGPDVVSTSEEIFYLKYSLESSWGVPQYYNGVGTPYLGIDGYYVIHSKLDRPLYVNWDDSDLRKQFDWYEWDTGLGRVGLIKKFSDPGIQTARNDYPLYRYTDLLLLYSEASCDAANGPTLDGVEKLNMVHRRAYGYDPLTPSPVDFNMADYNTQSFTELVIKERGYETLAEGKRWLDLKRTGKVKEYIQAAKGMEVSDKHLLWPIPISEINYNKNISDTDQNPGY